MLAARLSEDPACRVLLLEAGPDFPDEAERLPLFAVSGEHSWLVAGLPEFDWDLADRDRAGRRGGRPIRLLRGRLVGGSSMVNSTIAARPAPFDLDRWAGLGCPGWDWPCMLPVLRRIETDLDFGHDPIHGADGPIVIQRYRETAWAPVNRAFAEACDALGVHRAPDLNAAEGHAGAFGPMPHNRYKEVRQGTLVTYLRAAASTPEPDHQRATLVDRVLLRGDRAVGVRWIGAEVRRRNPARTIVVIAAGVYNTPGHPAALGHRSEPLLRRNGIPWCRSSASAAISPITRACLLLQGRRDRRHHRPNVGGQLARAGDVGREPWWQTHPFPVDEEEGVAGCGPISAASIRAGRGDRQRRSAAPPIIDHDYLADPIDIARFADAWEQNRALLASSPFARRAARFWSRLDLAGLLHANIASAHHQSGTCRMGPTGNERRRFQPARHGFERPDGRRFEHVPRHRHAQHQPRLLALIVRGRVVAATSLVEVAYLGAVQLRQDAWQHRK